MRLMFSEFNVLGFRIVDSGVGVFGIVGSVGMGFKDFGTLTSHEVRSSYIAQALRMI